MSDPILLFLAAAVVALPLLGAFATTLRLAVAAFVAASLSGLAGLLCLLPLFIDGPSATLSVPIGPPGLSLSLALDSVSALFLVIVFLAGSAVAAFHATTNPAPPAALLRTNTFCVAGAALSLLAADGISLAIGLGIMYGAIPLSAVGKRNNASLVIPLLMFTAICMLTPSGFAPRFDTIRGTPADPLHAAAAAMLTITAFIGLGWRRSTTRCGMRDALSAAIIIPASTYLLLRIMCDLSGSMLPPWPGFILLLIGGALATVEGWRSVSHADIDGLVACLMRRQAALVMIGAGLAAIAAAADLPEAGSFALANCLLAAIGSSVAGILTIFATMAIGTSAGTYRLSSLGGVAHGMPRTSIALGVGLLGLSALPPGLGFAGLWLLFQSILSAPRTGGLFVQLLLALVGGTTALSAALTTTAAVRLIGIALLGRPRTPLGAAAQETKTSSQTVLMVLSGLSLVAGILPGPLLWAVADPAIHALTASPRGARFGLGLLSASIDSPGYLAIPVSALLALAIATALLVPHWSRREGRIAGLWSDGMEPPAGLPFGEASAQSAGDGFAPALVTVPLPEVPVLPAFLLPRLPGAKAGLWLLVAACAAMLIALAIIK